MEKIIGPNTDGTTAIPTVKDALDDLTAAFDLVCGRCNNWWHVATKKHYGLSVIVRWFVHAVSPSDPIYFR